MNNIKNIKNLIMTVEFAKIKYIKFMLKII
jgi:hypothetical protein